MGPGYEIAEVTTTHYRTLTIEHTRADDDARTVPCVLSTDAALDMGGYVERLLHTPAAVDLSRAPLPLLIAHDNRSLPIGSVEQLRLENGQLRAVVRFGSSAKALEVFEDVKNGIARSVSLGYFYDDDGFRVVAGVVEVFKWQALEASVVAVPADARAGFYRSMKNMSTQDTTTTESAEDNRMSRRQRRVERMRDEAEDTRVREIEDLVKQNATVGGDMLKEQAATCIERGWDVDMFRELARYALKTHKPTPIRSAPGLDLDRIHISGGEPVAFSAMSSGRTDRPSRSRLLQAFGPTEALARRSAYVAGMWARAALLGDRIAERWLSENGHQRMMGRPTSKGGALVPEEMSSAIVDLREEFGIARSFARVIEMNSDTLAIPRRVGGVTGHYVGEGAAIPDQDGEWDFLQLVARKWAALTRISTELIEDAVIDVVSHMAGEFAYAFATVEDAALFTGDGTSTHGGVVGLSSKLTSGMAGAVPAAAGHNTFAEIDVTDLATLMSRLPMYAHRGAAFYCSQPCHALVFQRLGMASGGALMAETGRSQLGSWAGYPIRLTQTMPTSNSTLTGAMIYFGSLEQAAIIGSRRDMRLEVLSERFSDTDEIGVKATVRFDIVCHSLGDTSNPGPLVALFATGD